MIDFNEIQLSDDRKTMNIEVEISDTTTYPDYYISDIYIEYYKYRNASGAPSESAYHAFINSGENPDTTVTSKTLEIDAEDLLVQTDILGSFKDGLFYVIVLCKCTSDSEELTSDMAAVPDWQAIYDIGMNYVASLNKKCGRNECITPVGFEQFVLVWHALELALDAQDMDMIDKLWARFINYGKSNSVNSLCNCQ